MKPIPNDVDWSATAAWIALVISVLGTIAGPIITTILTNRHQLKLRNLDIKEKILSAREDDIKACISSIGACCACANSENISLCGKNFPKIYPYVPVKQWDILDSYYKALLESDTSIDRLHAESPAVIHLLASLLIEAQR